MGGQKGQRARVDLYIKFCSKLFSKFDSYTRGNGHWGHNYQSSAKQVIKQNVPCPDFHFRSDNRMLKSLFGVYIRLSRTERTES